MTGGPDLTSVSSSDLRALLRAVHEGRLHTPLDTTAMQAVGLGGLARTLGAAASLDRVPLETLLAAVIAEREARPTRSLDLVWTGPDPIGSRTRDTAVVVREMLASAQESVLVAGFRFSHGAEILQPLHAAMRDRSVRAQVVLDAPVPDTPPANTSEAGRDLHAEFLRENWAFGSPEPDIFFDPRTRQPGVFASMHAKCLVVDRREALITSANFTARGQSRNIEVGVRVLNEEFATQLHRQWQALIDAALLERAR
ncbi:MAG: DISARM system phospholipase D-like protein DrmC [Planctomycetota bacterium]